MLEQKTVLIGDVEITIQQLGTSKALKHSIILGQLFGGVSQGIASQGKTTFQDWDIDFGRMIDGILSKLDSEKSPAWIKELIKESVIQPAYTQDWFDITFSGSLENLLELVKAILEQNYGGLFEYARKKIGMVSISDTSSTEKKAKKQKE